MDDVQALVDDIARELRPIVDRLLTHPYVEALADGRIPREQLRIFAGEQYAIIASDLKSVAHTIGRFGGTPDMQFFLDVLAGERAAAAGILAFGQALGWSEAELQRYEPLAGAHAYTCYMAWLALFGSPAEVAAAYLANFPAWGRNCGRLSGLLQQRYGLAKSDVVFFDNFAAPAPEFQREAAEVIRRGLVAGVDPTLIHRSARLLQAYELTYWDTLYAQVGGLYGAADAAR
ncbi:MAG: transcriptional regulator [Chloroflexi bacterium]|nr:transcriptional regulator [Chloroflexota bacterium]